MVESGPMDKITRLQALQEKAIRIVDNNEYRGLGVVLANHYRLQPLNHHRELELYNA